jgi:hypothetical protein
MYDLDALIRQLRAAMLSAGESVNVPTELLRALVDDYADARDARSRLTGYQERLSAALGVASWAVDQNDEEFGP